MTAGYSGTPLAKKLSLKDGIRTWWDRMPDSVRYEITSEGLELQILDRPEPPIDARTSSSPNAPTSQPSSIN